MQRLTLRINDTIVESVEQYCRDHGISTMQDAYRRLIVSGLSQETKFDKKKTLIFEDEAIQELKVITNILSNTVSSSEDTKNIRAKISDHMSNIQIIKR